MAVNVMTILSPGGRIANNVLPPGSFVTSIIGDGITTDFFIPHDLESLSLVSAIYDQDGQQVDALVTCVSLNNVVVQFGTPPESDIEFKIVLMK